ncbi:MAG TPA: YitT family protein [Rhabdochlamydiaceae bacterium]|nr:YitT family protein [Rhabdochlamydiaceae bacterium]
MVSSYTKPTRFWHYVRDFFWIAVGAFLAAVSIRIFLFPNQLIDGGVVGVALILARIFGDSYVSYFLLVLNLPFVIFAFRLIRRTFVINMLFAILLFAGSLLLMESTPPFRGDVLEIVVFGGAILGVGVGLIIRNGGCVDGTEILAIILNRKWGFTIGQIVLVANIFIFGAYGLIFRDWHIALQSLMAYVVAFKMIDLVIVGLDELKSVMVMSSKPTELAKIIMKEMGLGLTIMHGKGGYSGASREIIFIIVERLDLAQLKEIVLREDPEAFMAIENLHEVVTGKKATFIPYRKRRRGFKKFAP